MIDIGEHARSHVLDVRLDRDTEMAALRRQVDAALADLGGDHRYDVLLVVSELVSNVLDHTTGPGHLRLARVRIPCQVAVEVDDSSPLAPVCGSSRLGGRRGRGMVMVNSVAHRWGTVLRSGGGKMVYALLQCGGNGLAARLCPGVG